MKNIKYLLASLFIFLYNTVAFAQFEGEDDVPIDTEAPGAPKKTPVDMYEWALLLVAVSLIMGYYLYKRNRRLSYFK